MKKIAPIILVITLMAALCLFAACASTPAEPADTPDPEAVEPEQEPEERTVTVTDMSGDSITITGEVKRIINLWPAGTSSFYVMGAGDLLVGQAVASTVNEWTQFFYPEAVNIPALGGISPSIEDIIKLEPDLVIIHPTTAADGYAQQIRDVGIPAININFSDYESMNKAYTILGEVLGGEYQQKLQAWCAAVETKIANVRSLTADITEEDRPVVFYIAGQTDSLTTTMAANSIVNDWVTSAGGIYASTLLELTAAEVTPEAVFDLNPDVIICGGVFQHVEKNAVETTAGWKDLAATVNSRLYTNPYACFNWDRFGLESQLQINYALMCIQPEIAAANGIDRQSMISEVIDFYRTYTNVELTAQQAEYMLDGLGPEGTAENPVQ